MPTQPTPPQARRFAVLVDGDNAQPRLIEPILNEVAKYGQITIRRIYGDWTTPNLGGWKECLHVHAIQPVQQFRFTVGKNATDSALIIDAMDLLHRSQADGFAIISSDSDYTRLATRLREDGRYVLGVGRKATPKAFINACDVFVVTENLLQQPEEDGRRSRPGKPAPKDATPLLLRAFALVEQEDEWAELGPLGTALIKLDPAFDPRSYGFSRLSSLLEAEKEHFEVRREKHADYTAFFVRCKTVAGESRP